METKRIMRSFLKIAITAFLVFLTGNAFAIDNNTRVVSPYWQVDSGSYTFIAVSHTSLSGMNSQISLSINAIQSDAVQYGQAASFTINSGTTQRIFIVPTAHTTLNPTSLTDSDVSFIRGTATYKYGHIYVKPTASHPNYKFIGPWDQGTTTQPTIDVANKGKGAGINGQNQGFRDVTMLSYWGSVVVEANTTGFAMEFIGDLNDSQGGIGNCEKYNNVRKCVTSGVNLQ